VRTSQETDKVLPALFNVKKKLRPMVKDSANPFFKSKYLELSDILTNLEPLLHEEGLFLTQATIVREGATLVINRVTHAESCQFAESEFPAETATADPQKLGSAVSYARRYGVQSLLALNTVDDDGNAASGKTERKSNFNAPKKEAAAEEPKQESATPVTSSRRGSFGRS
jgi:hypothetical protein